MRLLALLVGVSWGAGLGFLAGLLTSAAAAGVGWLFVFGDNAWPPAFHWLLAIIGVVAGAGTLLGCVLLARQVADRLDARMPLPAVRLRRMRALALVLAAVPPLAAVGLLTMRAGDDQRRQDAQRAVAEFAERAPRITAATFHGWNDGQGRVSITLAGGWSGTVRLAWTIKDSVYGRTLSEGERRLTVTPVGTVVDVTLQRAALIAAYRQRVLTGTGAVRVEDATRLTVTLLPVPGATQLERLPRWVAESPPTFRQRFGSRTTLAVPLAFTVTGGAVY